MTPRQVADLIYDRVCGTCNDILMSIDDMIEEGEIDQDFFRANEMEILGIVDSIMFNCAICGWNYEISEVSMSASNMSDIICNSCGDEHED